MKYKVGNTRPLTPDELVSKLCKSAKLYSEYADTTILFIFREKKSDAYDYYEVRFGKNNFMHLAGIKSETLNAVEFYNACLAETITRMIMEMSNRNPATLARYSLPDWKCCWNIQSVIIDINPQYHGGESAVLLTVLVSWKKVKYVCKHR